MTPRCGLHPHAFAAPLAVALAAACTPRDVGEDDAALSASVATASAPRVRGGVTGRLDPALIAELEADDAPSVGAAGAELVLVAFGDFTSPHCARASAIAALVEREYGARVRFVFRQLPSASPVAELAAAASLEAHAQGRFWNYHDVLFANQRALERASLERYAAELGLDRARFARALGGGVHAAAIERDRELASLAGVVRAPALFADGERVRVPTDLVALRELVVARLARPDGWAAGARRDRGRGDPIVGDLRTGPGAVADADAPERRRRRRARVRPRTRARRRFPLNPPTP